MLGKDQDKIPDKKKSKNHHFELSKKRNLMKKKRVMKNLKAKVIKTNVFERIFNATLRYDDIDNNDIITVEESYERILACGVYTALMLTVPASIMTLLFGIAMVNRQLPIEILPNITVSQRNLTTNGYSIPHMAIIYIDGSVYDYSLENSISPSKDLLIKLQNETGRNGWGKRYAYQDQFGTLYFISSTISRPITQLQQNSEFRNIHHNLKLNSPTGLVDYKTKYRFNLGTQVGNMFWVWGFIPHGNICKMICKIVLIL